MKHALFLFSILFEDNSASSQTPNATEFGTQQFLQMSEIYFESVLICLINELSDLIMDLNTSVLQLTSDTTLSEIKFTLICI